MAKKGLKKEPSKPPEKIKYEYTMRYKAIDHMMRKNKGITGPM